MNCNKKVELLSPARDKITAFAAINYGADAVYIGAPNFGARKNAANSIEDIKEIVEYAHKFYARVHVTINTILKNEELEAVRELIKELYEIGVDAIIIQDMAILEMAVEGKLPPIEIHASTQCDNRTLEKVKFFEKIGISRVILARELSLAQIKDICTGSRAEIETFIHGALCVSYSGQCYFSAAIGGRSANRGECAQACRKKYTLVDESGKIYAKDKHLLSLRDFNASKHLPQLINAGVKSFKIEGRLKDINYVKNVTAYYRTEIDKFASKTSSGKVFLDFEPDVYKSFNRGFTDYFLEDRKNCYNFKSPKSRGEKLGKVIQVGQNWFKLDSRTDLNSQDGLCWRDEGCLVNKFEQGRIYPNQMNSIKIGDMVYRNLDAKFEKKLEASKTKRKIAASIVFANKMLSAADEDGNRAEIKVTQTEAAKNSQKMNDNFTTAMQKTGESDFYITNIIINDDLPFMQISALNEYRRILLEKLMCERLKNYPKRIQEPLKYADFPKSTADYHANVSSACAKTFYKNCNCEITEFAPEVTNDYRGKELMRTKHCLKFAFGLCKQPKNLYLIDEKGKKYSLKIDCKNCEMCIYDYLKYILYPHVV